MRNLQQRAERIARARQSREVAMIAGVMAAELTRARVEAEAERVIITGRGLVRRWLVDPALRFVARGAA